MTVALEQHRSTPVVGLSGWAVIVAAVLQVVLDISLANMEAEASPSAAFVALTSSPTSR